MPYWLMKTGDFKRKRDRMTEVVIVGGIVTDRMSYYDEIPFPGIEVVPNYIKVMSGGKGANMAVMSAKLRARTSIVSMIGDDDYGKRHLKGLGGHLVNTEYVQVDPDVNTDMVDILVASDGQNRIDVVSRTCMYRIRPSDVERAERMIKEARVIGCIPVPHIETSVAALRLGRKYGLTTLFNAAPLLDCTYISEDVYKLTDVFFCNEFEASTITDRPCHTIAEVKSACRCLLERGCRVAVITLGERGCVYAASESHEAEHLPARQVQAVDSTGASDAFFGALCFYFARYRHLDIREKLQRSMEIATISVMKEGTQASYPNVDELSQELLS